MSQQRVVVLPIFYRDLGMRLSERLAESQSVKPAPSTTA